ncbi:hypothetical protein FSP39_016378 [Pinctada imbricata]|uniref:Uncharacterized protein n=1 Tax=Pinctada imbricata TaxID=66713 RepID=A0AA89BPX9_PINIB|nr:hypothetical protein FSP39_016378 [Pinctada imbricata]
MSTLLFLFIFQCLALVSHGQMFDDQTSAPFEPEEQFLDIFPLTKDNFTESVLKNKDPWIILFHSGTLARTWKTMAVNVRGVVWCGMIDIREEEELLKSMKYTPNHDPESRVYPHGPISIKKKEMDEVSTPVPYKALSNRFSKYFNFGRMMQPTLEDYKVMGMQDYFLETPLLLVLVAEYLEDPHKNPDVSTMNMGFSAIQFNERKHGGMNYPNVLKFLFAINYKYRYRLPGDNQSDVKVVAEMEDIIEIEQKRFDVRGYSKNVSGNTSTKESNGIKFKATATPVSASHTTKEEL